MGKSENGPDMLDCFQLMYSLESDWGLSISILVECDGSLGGGGGSVHIVGIAKALVNLTENEGVAVSARWPDRQGRTWEGLLFQMLHQIDHLLEEATRAKNVKNA
jgi:hypothetical protein